MVMFSPPYWWARDFGQESVSFYGGKDDCQHEFTTNHSRREGGNFCFKCGGWMGELGLECDLQVHINNIKMICDTIQRILKKTGSLFLNIGDTYGTHSGNLKPRSSLFRDPENSERIGLNMKKLFSKPSNNFILEKNLFLIPARIAMAIQDAGWTLRNDIIWYKTSVLHTGAKDRLTNTYEHILWFVKSTEYFCDLNSVKVPCASTLSLEAKKKNLGDVWLINTKPRSGGVGAYPDEICEIPIKMCCPENGIVLDPMCGIGTTCVVAKRLRHKFIGIDIISENVLIAKDRLLGVCPKCGRNTIVAKNIGKIVCISCDYEDTFVKQ
jgi:site-specific DNA-methyltransferase (adenine-specific)